MATPQPNPGTTARPRSRGALVLGGVLTVLLVLSSCGSSPDEPAAGTAFNRTDVQFAQDMIPRQRQAATMSALARTHSSDPGVIALAARIHRAQGPWTEDMNGCLSRWDDTNRPGMRGSGDPDNMMGSDDPGDMMGSDEFGPGGSNGMMSRDGLEGMATMRGAVFDRTFLKEMVQHHQATLDLAKRELARGTSPTAKNLAAKVQMRQGPELKEMRRLMQP